MRDLVYLTESGSEIDQLSRAQLLAPLCKEFDTTLKIFPGPLEAAKFIRKTERALIFVPVSTSVDVETASNSLLSALGPFSSQLPPGSLFFLSDQATFTMPATVIRPFGGSCEGAFFGNVVPDIHCT